jgi:hypothetical protein
LGAKKKSMKNFILAISFPISLFLTCVACFGVLVLLESISDRREEKRNLFSQLYSIQPESLLDGLEQGRIGVFIPIDEEPPWPSPDQQITVPWTQEDYLRITNALFAFIWSDTLADWQLNDMSFGSDCEKYDIGLQYGSFTFFKNEEINGNKIRMERFVSIDSRDKTVYATENKYYPRLVDWPSIALIENLLSAEEALQRAENAGGKEKRLSVANACDISLLLNQDVGLWNKKWWWKAYYSQRDDKGLQTTRFSVDINPYTGELRP